MTDTFATIREKLLQEYLNKGWECLSVIDTYPPLYYMKLIDENKNDKKLRQTTECSNVCDEKTGKGSEHK